jgi:hypothetical protein
VKRGVRQGERRAHVVRHYEYRSVERGLVAPPALPFVVVPRPALWAELVGPMISAPMLLAKSRVK